MHDAAIDVPGGVSIIGFDDMPGADNFIPGLTTVRQDWDTRGQQCIPMLIAALNKAPNDFPLMPAILVIRESTVGNRGTASVLGPEGGAAAGPQNLAGT